MFHLVPFLHYRRLNLTIFRNIKLDWTFTAFSHEDGNSNQQFIYNVFPIAGVAMWSGLQQSDLSTVEIH